MDFATARYNMVEGQVRPNHVNNETLISALAALPREAFVPTEIQGIAYVDKEVPLGEGRYLMAPLVTARLAETAAPGPPRSSTPPARSPTKTRPWRAPVTWWPR